jgi:hypothetical protein
MQVRDRVQGVERQCTLKTIQSEIMFGVRARRENTHSFPNKSTNSRMSPRSVGVHDHQATPTYSHGGNPEKRNT